ncbi:hypothetical protein SDC9_166907 [bioreactor metagenome]|uniref:Uncharacterized protein n=1 Tax=bioreactor metagenome TaxID=1076179 RepID=A0A645G059_9ZZZZ
MHLLCLIPQAFRKAPVTIFIQSTGSIGKGCFCLIYRSKPGCGVRCGHLPASAKVQDICRALHDLIPLALVGLEGKPGHIVLGIVQAAGAASAFQHRVGFDAGGVAKGPAGTPGVLIPDAGHKPLIPQVVSLRQRHAPWRDGVGVLGQGVIG